MRRTKEEAEKTRQSILDAALEVFYRRGVTRTSLAEVAQEAGVTRGAVYWHFKDKFELYFTLYESLTERFKVRPEDYATYTYSSLPEFKQDLCRFFDTFVNDRQFHQFIQIMYSRMEYIEEMNPIIENEKKKQNAMISAYELTLEDLKKKGEIRSDVNCRSFAIILFTFIDGILDSWGIDESMFPDVDTVSSLLDELFIRLIPENPTNL